jgi:type IV secretion system protein VirB5
MKIKSYLVVAALMITPAVFATGMPVVDVAAIAQAIKLYNQVKSEYEELKNLRKSNAQQLEFLNNNLKGNFGYGVLSQSELKKHQWSNDSWSDVLENKAGGQPGFLDAQQKYASMYTIVKPQNIAKTRTGEGGQLARTYYEQSSQISRSALAASAYSYDQVNAHMSNLNSILAKLEDNPSEKAAIDLNARLMAELGFIQLEMLRQQNIQTQLLATDTQGNVNSLSDRSKFMKWDPPT